MKCNLVLALSSLIVSACAAGYQGCLERVWLFQAYELEGLIPAHLRTLGYGCPSNSWNLGTNRCTGQYQRQLDVQYENPTHNFAVPYVPCDSDANRRCTYEQLMNHMKTGRDPPNWTPADKVMNNGRIDARGTAIKCVDRYRNRPRGVVRNFPAWQVMNAESKKVPGENVHDFNEYTEMLGDKINDISDRIRSDSNRHLFDDMDATRNQIDIARAGDHGPFLVQAAQSRMTGTTIRTKDLGPDPVGNTNWQTVDWPRTIRDARAAGNVNINRDVKSFLSNFYRGTNLVDGPARKHYQMFRAYRIVGDKAFSCRGRT
ncbi:hypothetical protein P154DRAFT_532143 [Amniculicola lignicola CBS 123094]|uniref:Uncharacterized protein n=1 Tax=Amniculicola lignicola CBS 123094 TaxID=1392246 RepID=A0A6A5WQI3_9PLEO|nr:hypothetical protein P154DRAFT_532143 [Amniculicola lignicola CBS 123094]